MPKRIAKAYSIKQVTDSSYRIERGAWLRRLFSQSGLSRHSRSLVEQIGESNARGIDSIRPSRESRFVPYDKYIRLTKAALANRPCLQLHYERFYREYIDELQKRREKRGARYSRPGCSSVFYKSEAVAFNTRNQYSRPGLRQQPD